MMKRFLVSLAFIAFAISAAAAQLPAVLKAEPDGSVQLGNIGMYVIHIGEQWAGSMQRSLNPDEKTKIGPDRIFVSGSFPAANSSENFTFVEELLPTEAEKVSCSWRITAPQDVICRALAVSFDIPAGTAGTGITVDGTKVVLPEPFLPSKCTLKVPFFTTKTFISQFNGYIEPKQDFTTRSA